MMGIEIPDKKEKEYVIVQRYLQIPVFRCAGDKVKMFNWMTKVIRKAGGVVVEDKTKHIYLVKKTFKKIKE